MSREPERAT